MSIPEPLRSITRRWWDIGIAFVSLLFAMGMAYGTITSHDAEQDRRIDALSSIDRRLSNIEGHLNIQTR